jgi:cobalt-zinc-cadmium efflux system outer membrane protein
MTISRSRDGAHRRALNRHSPIRPSAVPQRGRAQAEIGVAEADLAVEAQNIRLADSAGLDRSLLCQAAACSACNCSTKASAICRLRFRRGWLPGRRGPAQALEPEQLRAAVNDRRSELTSRCRQGEGETSAPDRRSQRRRFRRSARSRSRWPGLRAGLASLPRLQALDAEVARCGRRHRTRPR